MVLKSYNEYIIDKLITLADKDRSGLALCIMYLFYSYYRCSRTRLKADRVLSEEAIAKKADTIFILGSGSSVCKLGEKEINIMNEELSIGINTWVFHGFVPDAYGIEPVGSNKPKRDMMSKALQEKQVTREKPIVFLKDNYHYSNKSSKVVIPQGLEESTYSYTSVPIITRERKGLKRSFRIFHNMHKAGIIPFYCVADRGASIVRFASLAMRLNVDRIVFVGVDLNHSEYFWERDNNLYRKWDLENVKSGQTGDVHETDDPNKKRFRVSDVINGLSRVSKEIGGPTMLVENESSALAKHLDVYKWA